MQSKGAIKLLAILLAIACIYQLSFSFKTRSVEKKAAAYAAAYDGDERSEREQYYLDSVQNQPVYNLGFRKFTYKEIKEKELNLGLDLKGGMNVMLEIQVEDVVKSLAGDSKNDPAFIEAMAQAKEGLRRARTSSASSSAATAPLRTVRRWPRFSSAPTVRTSRPTAPTPRSRRSCARRPTMRSTRRSTSCAAVSTTSA